MLYKPTNPSPYNSVVDQPTETSPLTFTASCVSTSSITGMRLAIKNNTTEYYLPAADDAVSQCKTTSGIAIPYQSATFNSKKSYSIKTSNFTRTDGLSNEAISKIIQPLTSYRWQVRLYQDSTDINIGYGFVQDVINFNNSSKPNRRILKVRPHTNMFMGKSQRDEAFDSSWTPEYNKGWNKNLTEYYDDKVVYQIQFSGKSYNILNYYYSKEPAYYVGTKPTDLISEKQYDEPLFAFIEIDLKTGDAEIEENAEYTILTNYIDSNEYYFSCRQLGTLKFTDPRITGEDKEVKFVSIDELDANPEDHIYSPTHSNVQIKGSFDAKSGATINYYHATLYQVLSNGEDIQIHDSGYVYNSEVDYDCKDLLSGNTYKLVISVTDTYGNTVSKGVYIEPDCKSIVKTTLLSVETYPKRNSVILDFGKLLSITGVESNPYNGSYKIGSIEADWDGDLSKYTTIIDGLQLHSGTPKQKHIDVKACSIAPNNTVSFSKIDGTDKAMECQDPLISMTFRCNNGDTQTIFEFTTGDSTVYKLTWEAYRFHLWIGQYITKYYNKTVWEFEGGRLVERTVTEEIHALAMLQEAYYSPYDIMSNHTDAEILQSVQEAISDSKLNYSVPYLALPNLEMDSNSYLHTESVAHDFWWHTIVHNGMWYIKCINAPQEYLWVRDALFATHQTVKGGTANLTLYGGCVYCNILIDEYKYGISYQKILDLQENPLRDLVWDDNTVFQANFANGQLAGGNFEGGFAGGQYGDVDHYRIYKTFGNQPELHKIFKTNSAQETIVEDFTVGSECEYTYYIVPVCIDSSGNETTGSIIKSDPITLHDGTVRVIGLIQDDEDFNTYYVDMNNVWNFSLNMSNPGFQNNMGKTYNDTPQKYPVEVKNKGFYRTFSINGLLGKFNCDTMEYIDTYDDIIEWEKFVDNGEMKLVIDLRGIMTVGTMESNSIDYDEHGAKMVSVNFSIRQLEDINNITILNRKLLLNPTDGKLLLKDVNDLALHDNEDKYLIVEGGE